MSRSSSEKSRSRDAAKSPAKASKHKLFVTNLDGSAKEEDLKSELQELFSKYGTIKDISVKRNRNAEYSFAFVEYEEGAEAEEAVRILNGTEVKGKSMKVELQEDSKRRKDPEKGCYNCGMMGHFARECKKPSSSGRGGHRRRSRSRSSSYDRDRRRRRRSHSYSSERNRNKSSKKDRKRSKDRKEKKSSKKHKKERRRSSSGSN